MAKVRILPDRVANQIAAGEVIERPAAVVKELVENALDAGATRIEVEFSHGGRSLMRIEDNGSGMTRDDALLALERHATSKIAEAADLDRLHTFGFRGEALPSIASVSRFELQTRVADSDVGTEILINGGKFVHVRDCGRPVGTRMEVTHLFNSVPARRKFLKTDATEAAHIVQCVRLYALASPQVAFTLIEDSRVIFRSPECSTLAERVTEIFGQQIAESLIEINSVEPGLKLSGLIGRPGVGRATRHEMIVFVNGRPVDSRTLNYALIESYHESLPKGRYPLSFVFFECDPAAVDVNVHPAKREVRFRSEPQVRGFVIRSVLHRLREVGAPVAPLLEAKEIRPIAEVNLPSGLARLVVPGPLTSFFAASTTAPIRASLVVPSATIYPQSTVAPEFNREARPEISLTSWRYIGLAHGSYALFETSAGLVLLDRRAAHERIWFDRLVAQFDSGSVPCQRLLLPIPLQLDPIAAALLIDRTKFLGGHGFEIGEFGRNFFRIEAVPTWMEPADAESFVRDLLGAIRDGRLPENNLALAREELARMSAAKAIRLLAAPAEAALRGLVAELFATRTPLTSPSGRPTFIELNHSELARRFQK
jgi:DNA mismatch repair protein MutL